MKYIVLICLFLCPRSVAYAQADTFMVYFALKDASVSRQAGTQLDALVKNKIKQGDSVMLMGYADYRGTAGFNDTISLQRAINVKAYLAAKGITGSRITTCIGKGKIERPGMTGETGNAPDRKVLIIINHTAASAVLEQVKVNETVALKNISFYPGQAEILPSSFPELENLYRFLEQNKTVTIQIEGHICCYTASMGDDLQLLSGVRARAIYDYLVGKGIAAGRMKYLGFGFTKPLVFPEQSEEDRQRNRRVEIRILSK